MSKKNSLINITQADSKEISNSKPHNGNNGLIVGQEISKKRIEVNMKE